MANLVRTRARVPAVRFDASVYRGRAGEATMFNPRSIVQARRDGRMLRKLMPYAGPPRLTLARSYVVVDGRSHLHRRRSEDTRPLGEPRRAGKLRKRPRRDVVSRQRRGVRCAHLLLVVMVL